MAAASRFRKGASNPGALTSGSSNWNALAQIKAEGNVAFGIGAEADFGISLALASSPFIAKPSLVFGLGAGGGFGTVIDLEKVWDLIVLVCETLHDVEYRPILGIEEQAFGAI